MKNELVDVYAKTVNGWELLYKDKHEDIATEVWRAGFRPGENNITIERKADREFLKKKKKKLHKH